MFKDRKLFEKEQEVTRKQKEAVSLSRRSGLDMLLLKAGGKDEEAQASRREMVSHHLEMSRGSSPSPGSLWRYHTSGSLPL